MCIRDRCHANGHISRKFSFPLPDKSQRVGKYVSDSDEGQQHTQRPDYQFVPVQHSIVVYLDVYKRQAACPAGSPYAGVAERQRIASSIVAVPKLGTTTTPEYSFMKAICQSTGGWLFCRSRIWKFYFRLRLALRLGGMRCV